MSTSLSASSILLVDDDTSFTTVMSRAFQRRDYQVTIAHTIDEALTAAKQHNFDRAVVDLKMTNESGLKQIGRAHV